MSMNLNKIATRIASGKIRTAGRIEFVKDQGPVRRDLRVTKFKWDPDTLRNLAKILWATERAHSYAIASLRLFSKMPSSEFSPDGLLGGRGYIQTIKDMRTGLSQAVEFISSFTDTLHDEINAEHWSTAADKSDAGNIVGEAQAVKENPEGYVQQEFEKSAPGTKEGEFSEIINPGAQEMNPQVVSPGEEEDADEDEDGGGLGWGKQSATVKRASEGNDVDPLDSKRKGPGSKLPEDKASDYPYAPSGKTAPEQVMHTVTPDGGSYGSVMKHAIDKIKNRVATGAIDTNTLPGPRVDHLGPGENADFDERPSDDPILEGFSQYDRILEGPDANADGVSKGYPPNLGDSTVYKLGMRVADSLNTNTYSWLPGSNNDKNLDYYAPGLSDADIEWMKAHSKPELPAGMKSKAKRLTTDPLWEIDI